MSTEQQRIGAPRRYLSRQRRHLLPQVAHGAVMAELAAQRMPTAVDMAQLSALFARVWKHGSDASWSVAELKAAALLPRDVAGRQLGQALAQIADMGLAVDRWAVVRVDTGPRKLAEGRLWRLQRRW